MPHESKGPAGGGSPTRAGIVGDLNSRHDTTTPTSISTPAAAWVSRRFGLTADRAALVATMAGIGINIAPALPALMLRGPQ